MFERIPHSLAKLPRAGIGLRGVHLQAVTDTRPPVGWFEVHTENYLGGGSPVKLLDAVRRDYPLSLHGVGLSLGSAEGIDERHLARIAELVHRFEPELVSEHLSWSIVGGTYLNDLLPLPLTEEALRVVARNVMRMQVVLKRRVLIENPSTYLAFAGAEMSEPQFLRELSAITGCGILCDVNNIYVSARNHGFDPMQYLLDLPARAVSEIHLAGHAVNEADGVEILIDDHGSRVCEPVWELYRQAVGLFPWAPALIEWDTEIPPLDVLVSEASRADCERAAELASERHRCADVA